MGSRIWRVNFGPHPLYLTYEEYAELAELAFNDPVAAETKAAEYLKREQEEHP